MEDCTPIELHKRLSGAGQEFLLLDVRTPEEHATARIAGSLLIPMQEIPKRLAELESWRGREIVVHCHHGMRSERVQQFLLQMGFGNVRNLEGGIELYSVEADPTVPRY